MATSTQQDRDFIRSVLPDFTLMLEDAIVWISKNLNPDDVFDERQLEQWAEANGYERKAD